MYVFIIHAYIRTIYLLYCVYALRCMYGMVWYGMQAANVHLHLNEVFVVLVLAEHHLLHILRQVVEEVSVDAAQLHTYIYTHHIVLY